jgi:hypothetical protein
MSGKYTLTVVANCLVFGLSKVRSAIETQKYIILVDKSDHRFTGGVQGGVGPVSGFPNRVLKKKHLIAEGCSLCPSNSDSRTQTGVWRSIGTLGDLSQKVKKKKIRNFRPPRESKWWEKRLKP